MMNKKERLIKKRDEIKREIDELSDKLYKGYMKNSFEETKKIIDKEIELARKLSKITDKIIKLNNKEFKKNVKDLKKNLERAL